MIDINLLRTNPKLVKENIKKKFQDDKLPLVDEAIKLDSKIREVMQKAQALRAERNNLSKNINEAKKAGKDVKAILAKAKKIPDEITKLENEQNKLQNRLYQIMLVIPNIMHKSVPKGKDASQNVVREKIGKAVKPKYEIFNHARLAEKINGADFETARNTSGKGFYYLKGDLALLAVAMINFARDYMIKQGFNYVEPPLMVRRKVVEGVMSFKEMEDMMYKIEGEDLYLIGTSEHPLIGLYMDRILDKKDLPENITGFSSCFRKEVGAHGLEEKGFYRLHQFNKQEMIVICEPNDSYKWYDKMLKYTVDIFRKMEIPVQVLEICSGDLADLKAKSCDVEAWSPRQGKYFEVGSLTNMEEAQARRLNIKIQDKDKKYFAHTLNNTVIATPRALIALMENHQQKDGSIKIPKVLVPYIGKTKIGGK